jgi:hypothetical protein
MPCSFFFDIFSKDEFRMLQASVLLQAEQAPWVLQEAKMQGRSFPVGVLRQHDQGK